LDNPILHPPSGVCQGSARSAEPQYWWRLPDDEPALMGLGLAELRCYLVVMRAIQRDRNRGRLSVRQIAERARLSSLGHVHSVLAGLVKRGMLVCDVRPGSTAVYRLPALWKGDVNCSAGVEQLRAPLAAVPEQRRSAAVEQNCSAGVEQHLEYLENSELLSPLHDSWSEGEQRAATAALAGRIRTDVVPPPDFINEYGRRCPNPVAMHVDGVLRAARRRIDNAENPAAYEDKIVRDELAVCVQRFPPARFPAYWTVAMAPATAPVRSREQRRACGGC
jgi:hypothetical protein